MSVLAAQAGRAYTSRPGITGWIAVVVTLLTVIAVHAARADDTRDLARDSAAEVELISPTEPRDAEETFAVEPGFRIELVAAEPLVMDPVGMSFDERGRLFVAEMRGYNQGSLVPAAEARKRAFETAKLGRVKLLEDTNGDGHLDKSTVYVDDLIWPSGVFAYEGGVFVAAAPDLLYCKDTDGDGVADIRRIVLTGFGYSNWQHLPNSFRWGLDNRVHAASGSGGGEIRCPDRPEAASVLIRGRDFAFDPQTLQLIATNTSAQFGLSFDEWGNKFLTSNSDHILQVLLEDRYLVRNPFLAAPRSWRLIAAEGRGADVFRISPPEPHRVVWTKMRATGVIKGLVERGGAPTGYVTAASGTTIYLGDAWPAEYRGNAFTGECSGNLLHRSALEAEGILQVARRADQGREFLACRDIWFRPVNMLNGPDGNLYIADMYRQVINEGVVLPPTLRKHFDLTEGRDRGRIYRVVPEGFRQEKVPDLGQFSTADLVALLEHSNCWHFTTAARLLYERRDLSAVNPLKKMANQSSSPLGRMHAMYALDGLGALGSDVVSNRLNDDHPRVREHAVRLAERVIDESSTVREQLSRMTADTDIRVRYQLAFTLGASSESSATAALAAVASGDARNEWVRLAVLSSSRGRAGELFSRFAADTQWRRVTGNRVLLEQLAEQVILQQQDGELAKLLQSLAGFTAEDKPLGQAVVRQVITARRKASDPFPHELDSPVARQILTEMVQQAKQVAVDAAQPDDQRIDAIRTLTLTSFDETGAVLANLLGGHQPQAVAQAALQSIDTFAGPTVAETIVDAWRTLTPQLQGAAVEALFARRERLPVLLAAIDSGRIGRWQLDPARIRFLVEHHDEQIRSHASRVLGDPATVRRQDAVTAYQDVLKMTGNIARGKDVFKRECSKCHRLDGIGHDLGPPLTAIKDRGPEGILLNLLDPNRNVNPRYVNYVIVTRDGRSMTGVITAETANSIMLKREAGEADTVLRADIDELRDTGISIMPEGLERLVSKPQMADLLAYLMSVN